MKIKTIIRIGIPIVLIICVLTMIFLYSFYQGYAQRLISAVKQNDIVRLEKILGQPGNVNSKPYILELDRTNYPALHMACYERNFAAVKLLVTHDADINNTKSTNNRSPLIAVLASPGSSQGRLEIAEYLVNQGSDVNYCDYYRSAALSYVLRRNIAPKNIELEQREFDFVMFLLGKGAELDQSGGYGHLVFEAAACNNVKTLEYLIEVKGVDINLQNVAKYTPLMFASQYNCREAAEYLLQNNADRELKNNDGKTAFDLAIKYDNVEIISLLQ